jgi:hypothetical protein
MIFEYGGGNQEMGWGEERGATVGEHSNWRSLLANHTRCTLDPRCRKSCIPQLPHQLIDTLNLNGTEETVCSVADTGAHKYK